MTWKEFKAAVEAEGVTDEMDIWFIDVSFPKRISVIPQSDDDSDPNVIGLTVANDGSWQASPN